MDRSLIELRKKIWKGKTHVKGRRELVCHKIIQYAKQKKTFKENETRAAEGLELGEGLSTSKGLE